MQECEQVLEVLRKQERSLELLVHPEHAYQISSQVCKLHPCVMFHANMKLHPSIILCAFTSLQVCKLHLCSYLVCICFTASLRWTCNMPSIGLAPCQALGRIAQAQLHAGPRLKHIPIHLTSTVSAMSGLSLLKPLPHMDGL